MWLAENPQSEATIPPNMGKGRMVSRDNYSWPSLANTMSVVNISES